MFKKLHWQMTLFSAFITSLIIVALTCVCLFISESSLKKNTEASFLMEVNAMITHLQSQNSISLSWVNQMQENNHFLLYFYDNGTPLFSQRLYSGEAQDALAERAKACALSRYGMDISSTTQTIVPVHTEFSLTDSASVPYYVSAGVIPKTNSDLGFIVLYSLAGQRQQILRQRLLFAAADALAIFLLSVFAWFFTGRMLLPLEENRRKQIHFVSASSHELRAPLAVILSGADALGKATTAAERAHFLGMIQSEGIRMQHLISDMLFLARSDSGSFSFSARPVQPDILLMDAYERFERTAREKKLSLALSLPKEQLPFCVCDPERVTQILSILLDNALSYTPEGGRITLSLSMAPKRSGIRFGVSDTGPGIPDAQKDLIFDRFYRAESSHTDKNHFGLGLCIAKEILSAHRGCLWVEDAPGGGANFLFTLPYSSTPENVLE